MRTERFLVMYELEKSASLPLPNDLKLQQFVSIDMPYRKESYPERQIKEIALQKGATRNNLTVVSRSVIFDNRDLTPEKDYNYETE